MVKKKPIKDTKSHRHEILTPLRSIKNRKTNNHDISNMSKANSSFPIHLKVHISHHYFEPNEPKDEYGENSVCDPYIKKNCIILV